MQIEIPRIMLFNDMIECSYQEPDKAMECIENIKYKIKFFNSSITKACLIYNDQERILIFPGLKKDQTSNSSATTETVQENPMGQNNDIELNSIWNSVLEEIAKETTPIFVISMIPNKEMGKLAASRLTAEKATLVNVWWKW